MCVCVCVCQAVFQWNCECENFLKKEKPNHKWKVSNVQCVHWKEMMGKYLVKCQLNWNKLIRSIQCLKCTEHAINEQIIQFIPVDKSGCARMEIIAAFLVVVLIVGTYIQCIQIESEIIELGKITTFIECRNCIYDVLIFISWTNISGQNESKSNGITFEFRPP